jgi:PTS system maltose and glucose-specific IIC component
MEEKQKVLASKIIEGLGGFHNITAVNNCLTRLRVDIKNMAMVSDELLKKTGSMGIVRTSDTHIQVIYGPKVEGIASNVREVLKY